MEYFDRLGRELEDRWRARERDEDAFPDIAVAALEALPPSKLLDLEALIDSILDPHRPAARQLAPLGAFGQPGFTAHYGRGFVVDVYFWTHALSAIHDHPFRGAFTLLRGESVHARYAFEERARLGARVRLGAITLERLETTEVGRIERFGVDAHGLVHALLHVPIPSVSMVVRTIRTQGYFRYFPPGVALAMDEPDELIGRSLALLDALRAGGDPRASERLARFLAHADFETTFRALSRIWPALDDGARHALLEGAHARHGAHAERIAPALDAALRAHEADEVRSRLVDPDDRWIATAFVVAERRAELLAFVATRHADPVARLHRFLDEAGLFAPDEEASLLIARALLDGEGAEGALERLAAAYGGEAVVGREEDVRRYAARSMMAVLAR